jgi:hypothetical protein
VAGDIGHPALADWAAFIKRDLEGIVSVRAIRIVAERCPGLSRRLQCGWLRLVRLTLTAHSRDAVRMAEAAGIEFINENGGGPGVRLRERQRQKNLK